jgi:hypothetical protein
MRRPVRRFLILVYILCFLFGGCSKAGWTKEKIETHIKSGLKLSQVDLKETEKDKFEGTGRDAQGATFQIKATVTHSKSDGLPRNDLKWEATDSKGEIHSGGAGESAAQ